jgi:Flp pilus assembly protein TadG
MIADLIRLQAGRTVAFVFGTRSQRGQAIVETAGAMTALMLLVIGIVDFSPIVVKTAQLTQAVREGASYARTTPQDTTEIRKRVVKAAPSVYGNMTDAQIAAMTTSTRWPN